MFYITVKFHLDPMPTDFVRVATKVLDTGDALVAASELVREACQRRMQQCQGFTFVINNVNFEFVDYKDDVRSYGTEIVATVKTTNVQDLAFDYDTPPDSTWNSVTSTDVPYNTELILRHRTTGEECFGLRARDGSLVIGSGNRISGWWYWWKLREPEQTKEVSL